MYNVHVRTYATAQAREHLSEILTKAERGEGVFIERRGVRFRVEVVREAPARPARAKKVLEIVDAAVEDGQWSFDAAGNFGK